MNIALFILSIMLFSACSQIGNTPQVQNAPASTAALPTPGPTPSHDATTVKYMTAHNFSSLLKPKHDILGFIGPNYQRLYVNIEAITRDKSNVGIYQVKGNTKVKDNICRFTGTIKVERLVIKQKEQYQKEDSNYNDVRTIGDFYGNYEFIEDLEKKSCGIFEGRMVLHWFVSKKGKLYYDDIEEYADSYNNNFYMGSWREHNKEKKKIANWGEYRIPNSGDLDNGVGEFHANEKYSEYGW